MVHISQFYPCSRIDSAIELYYVTELGKYLKYKHEDTLSLNGVIINNEVRKSKFFDYFRMACDEGWLAETGVDNYVLEINAQQPLTQSQSSILNILFTEVKVCFDQEDFNKRQTSVDWDYRNPKIAQVSFSEKRDDYWIWEIKGKDGKFYSENKTNVAAYHGDMALISLVAYVAVERLKTGVPECLALGFSQEHCQTSMALSLYNALEEISDCFKGWVVTAYDKLVNEEIKNDLSYQSWYVIGKEKGMLSRWYVSKEKLSYLKELDIEVGDIVCLYKRKQAQKNNLIKSIANCNMAIVRNITNEGIQLEVINTVKNYASGKHDFDNNSMAVKHLYDGKYPYEFCNTSMTTLQWIDCGVEYMMQDEIYFITPIIGDDIQVRYIDNGEFADLTAQNLVYWILKDYKIDFGETRFLERYFKDDIPIYTRFHNGEDISFCYHRED